MDDLGNSYWYQVKLPKPGEAITLFVREIQTINEDYYFMTGQSWLGIEAENKKTQ